MGGFNHSIKVPTQYKRVAAVLKTAIEQKKSLKSLIFQEKHARLRGMQAVLKLYTDNRGAIDSAIEETKILEENPRLCSALCKILVTELILGRKQLNGESRPVVTVRLYKQKLIEAIEGKLSNNNTSKTAFKPRYVRVNTNELSVEEACNILAEDNWRKKELTSDDYVEFLNALYNIEEDEYIIDMHVNNLLIFHPKQRHYWACHEFIQEKKFLLQDKATSLVLEMLQPPPGTVFLDMCSAPGMKTIQACNIMKNTGRIYAIELNFERFNLMCSMVNTANCTNVVPINKDALTLSDEDCKDVEYILVDPSCSGSGMQNRMSLENDEKDDTRLKKLRTLQVKMLSHAMTAFPKVKRIAYSTCSLYEEENEQVVQRCLELHTDFKLLSGKKALRNKWTNTGNKNYTNLGKYCLYSRPESDYTDGIFIALFEKLH